MVLSVVIPVYNEVETVERLVRAVWDVELETQIILVDDGSTDGTRAVLARLEEEPAVRVLYHERNRGKGAALRTGIAAATGDLVIVQDADLEYDPRDFLRVVGPILDGRADVVYGSRFANGTGSTTTWHYLANRVLTALSNFFTDLHLTDMETCYKCFRREIIQSVALEEDRFGFEPEVTAKLARRDCRIWEVGITYRGRSAREGKKIGWKDGVRALWCVAKYSVLRRR
jgi:glycosyltransferase involved in cell wall biosynthesis